MKFDGHTVVTAPVDHREWDCYVEGHQFGQFQQSSAWAAAKAVDGWHATWVVLRQRGALVAGAQVLVKSTRLGRVGFVNKGPLVEAGNVDAAASAATALAKLLRDHRLRALLVHPPDRDLTLAPALHQARFETDRLLPLISATLIVDVSLPWPLVEAQFRRTRRQNATQALRRGVTIVEGDEERIPEFFRLMEATCRRQKTSPNPSSLESALALWRAFATPPCRARLHFAKYEGRTLAAGLCLAFGNRVTFWKKGWDQSSPAAHANTLLTYDAIRWAAESGYKWFDFAALDRDVATARLSGSDGVEQIDRRRDLFNLGFGGQPLLLPPAWIHFNNRLTHHAHRWLQNPFCRPFAQALGLGEHAHIS